MYCVVLILNSDSRETYSSNNAWRGRGEHREQFSEEFHSERARNSCTLICFCLLLLNIMFMRFANNVAYNSSCSFLLQCSILLYVYITIPVSILLLMGSEMLQYSTEQNSRMNIAVLLWIFFWGGWAGRAACGILVSRPGIKLAPCSGSTES